VSHTPATLANHGAQLAACPALRSRRTLSVSAVVIVAYIGDGHGSVTWFSLTDVVRWSTSVGGARGAVAAARPGARTAHVRLPERIEALVAALERTTAALDRAIPEVTRAVAVIGERVDHVDGLAAELAAELKRTAANLERILPEVSGVVGGMDSRLKSLDTTISDLGRVVFGLIDVIPGARRVFRRGEPPVG
jgi:hypothetical protein